jgi:hypothetical protein
MYIALDVYTSWQRLLKATVVVKQTKDKYAVISITALIFDGGRFSVSSSTAYCINLRNFSISQNAY